MALDKERIEIMVKDAFARNIDSALVDMVEDEEEDTDTVDTTEDDTSETED